MNPNDILKPAWLKLAGDDVLNSLLGTVRAVKGPRRPTGWTECFTLHISSNQRNPDTKVHSGTLLINYYCPNYSDGNVDIEKSGQVASRLIEIFDDNPPEIQGYRIADWSVREPIGPIPVQDNPEKESYMTVRISFTVLKG